MNIATFQIVNILIMIVMLIGIPWFMITVVKLLTKIENRLENLEKTMKYNKQPDLEGHNDSI